MAVRKDFSHWKRVPKAIDYARHPRKAWDALERVWVLGWVLRAWRERVLPLLPDLGPKHERLLDEAVRINCGGKKEGR